MQCVNDTVCGLGLVCMGQMCVAGCNAQHACAGGMGCCPSMGGATGCVALATDVNNCGVCGNVCATGSACCGGTCVALTSTNNCGACGTVCAAGQGCCNGACTSISSTTNCGACGNACMAGGACCGGTCQALTSATNCGACGNVCASGQGCCTGTCTSVSTNMNCGGCGMACAPTNGTGMCVSGTCTVTSCMSGFADCNKMASDGCEANLGSDNNNCGACGMACATGIQCTAGVCGIYGTGADGGFSVNADKVFAPPVTHLASAAAANATSITVVSGTGFTAGMKILVLNVRSNAGNDGVWEVADVASVAGTTLTLMGKLHNSYPEAANTLVQELPQYTNVTIANNVTLSTAPWSPSTLSGGIIAFFASGTVSVNGKISVKGCGYTGGVGNSSDPGSFVFKTQGESFTGLGATGLSNNSPNAGGGAGGIKKGGCEGSGGGGGGYGAAGSNGGANIINCSPNEPGGVGGNSYGDANLGHLYYGSGGGSGGWTQSAASGLGGNGGGIVMIFANVININGSIDASGSDGTTEYGDYGGGGGGSGGSIYLRHQGSLTGGSSAVVTGGAGGSAPMHMEVGGAGGVGRVATLTFP